MTPLPFKGVGNTWKKTQHDRSVDTLRARQPMQVDGSPVSQTIDGLYAEPTRRVAVNSGSPTQEFHFKSEEPDYIVCRTWDEPSGTEGDTDVYIAKPEGIRNSLASEVINGDTIEYNYDPDSTGNYSKRSAINDTTSDWEYQEVIRPYIVDQLVYATKVINGTGVLDGDGNEIVLLEINHREFARLPFQ